MTQPQDREAIAADAAEQRKNAEAAEREGGQHTTSNETPGVASPAGPAGTDWKTGPDGEPVPADSEPPETGPAE